MGLFSKDIKTMEDMFLHGLQDIYYAEHQITKALPKMIEKATNRDLAAGLKAHLEETNSQIERLQRRLLALSTRVARRLFDAGYAGRVVVVKVKYPDFSLQTRRVTLAEAISDVDSIYEAGRDLLDRFQLRGRPVRLLGVAVADLTAGGVGQTLTLFPDEKLDRRRRLVGI